MGGELYYGGISSNRKLRAYSSGSEGSATLNYSFWTGSSWSIVSTLTSGGAANFIGSISAYNFSGSSSGTNTGDQTLSGLGGVAGNSAILSDANAANVTINGGFYTGFNPTNIPSGQSSNDWGVMAFPLWTGNSSGERYAIQLAANLDSNTNVFIRKLKYTGTYTSSTWYNMLNSSNFQNYALPLSGGTLTGALSGTTATFTANSTTVTINSAARGIDVIGKNSYYGLSVTGGSGTGTSFGAVISAGTNSSDVSFSVFNKAETVNYFQVRGDGVATFSNDVFIGSNLKMAGSSVYNWMIQNHNDSNWGFGMYASGTLYYPTVYFSGDGTADRGFRVRNVGNSTNSFIVNSLGNGIFYGSVTATGFFESSDSRLKTLIEDNYQTKGIELITPKLYTKNGKVELGYYAQDFIGILDNAISKGEDDMLSLSYREVHTAKIYALEQRIKELESKLN